MKYLIPLLLIPSLCFAGPGDIIVKFRDKDAISISSATKVGEIRQLGVEIWRPKNEDDLGLMVELQGHPAVEWVELDSPVELCAIPNDPMFSSMWGLNQNSDIDIDAPEAWNTSQGEGALVAVVDTGCDTTHPDLAANIWVNPGEVPANGIDDDGNGYIDDIHGWDFLYNTPAVADTFGHGTHTAGTIGAVGNNGLGVIGVAPRAKLMIIKGFAANGGGSLSALCTGLIYSVDNGAKISSNSWVTTSGGVVRLLYDTITYCQNGGQLVVFAAANNGMDIDCARSCPGVTIPQPASYPHPALLVVAATQSNDTRASFSNFGIESVDLGAPGVSILSTYPTFKNGGGYQYSSGTSMACPHVAGAAALLLSNNPTLTADQLKFVIMEQGDPISSMAGVTVSGKRLNVGNFWSSPLTVEPTFPRRRAVPGKPFDIQGRRMEPTRSGWYFGTDTLVIK